MAKIIFTCFGSLGDLHPYIALAKTLQEHNHEVTICSSRIFEEHIKIEGIPFIHLRSNLDQFTTPDDIRQFLKLIFSPKHGGKEMIRAFMVNIEQTYLDTMKAAEDADLVISHPLTYATPLVCRELGKPWLSTALSPMIFMSTYEPPTLSPAPWLKSIHRFSPPLYRLLFNGIKRSTQSWSKPLYDVCKQQGINSPDANPVFEGQFSPHGTLAMFPESFAPAQPDWPVHTYTTGFPLFSTATDETEALAKLQEFLDAGEAPIVFALGSAAVNIAGDFYHVSAAAARQLGRRAVLVFGYHPNHVEGIEPNDDILMLDYMSYDKLFPKACAIVHQGGIGTLAQSMAAQVPMLIVPFAFDQFDNAERIEHMGMGKSLARKDYIVTNVTTVLAELLRERRYTEQAEVFGKQIKNENGILHASKVIEDILATA